MNSAVNSPGQLPDTVPALPVFKRLKYALIAFALQNIVGKAFHFYLDWKYYLSPPKIRPDIVKTYPCRPHLPIRIFFPRSSKPPSNLPALLTIHGGGFVFGQSTDNESWNRTFADTHNMIVVALNYAKAPGSPFPGPVYDIEALFVSVLADPSIPIDTERVALAGWSAGGNLTVAASQLDTVRSRLRAIVPLYPSVDRALEGATKARLRRYKPSLGGFRARPRDMLLNASVFFSWCYLPVGQKYRDPLLSPLYASRDALPKHIFVIACELDFLSHEAWRFASKLAGRVEPGMDEPVGRIDPAGKGELILDDERFHFEATTADGGNYRWLLVPDAVHGFDEPRISELSRDREMAEDTAIKREKVIAMIGEWLLAGPLKS
ncbi:Alpha beta hydrolase fold protein [Mycena sanguinolenta]|uniref:Alpha beta hydrolase fold protein n=1 Tax=Mycena sanguinolenta TaxID=230812 RepID=A0A8H6XTZ2_9AGAR|nr:Alpha beta hydrolase fold protein [Mycena sanguinolenta]